MRGLSFTTAVLVVAVGALLTPSHAEHPVLPAPEPEVASDQPPTMTAGQRGASELWNSLSDADKMFVREFVARNNLELISPDLLSLRARGKDDQAIEMLAKYYDLRDPVRAEIILKLLAYAHEQP